MSVVIMISVKYEFVSRSSVFFSYILFDFTFKKASGPCMYSYT